MLPSTFSIVFSAVTSIKALSDYGSPTSTRGLTVLQSYQIDSKIDDGIPNTGKSSGNAEATSVLFVFIIFV